MGATIIKGKTAEHITDIIRELQDAGYETYIVGGAVRDCMLDRVPKDYDISTAATPKQICGVFRKRRAFVIGKRFKLVHLHHGKEIIEISTFRQEPGRKGTPSRPRVQTVPENMIFRDNVFGTSEEDAWRRDFTVNSVFYDPCSDKLIDFTGMGLSDLENKTVRAIGDPALRFEEDPVRILRALKLVGQYGFGLEGQTAEAIRMNIRLITHASPSRLTLELEKILKNPYSHEILKAFQEHGFLRYYLPYISANWNSEACRYALKLLEKRNERVTRGFYRDSISLAIAVLTLPFIEYEAGDAIPGNLWLNHPGISADVRSITFKVFGPRHPVKRVIAAAVKMLLTQPVFKSAEEKKLFKNRSYSHGRELMAIQNQVKWNIPGMEDKWPVIKQSRKPRKRERKKFRNSPRRK
jgi:poly(A) polymerase